MVACDYCCLGAINFCNMCNTQEGARLHWEYIDLWKLNGCFPCDYNSPTYEWISKTDDWFINMLQAYTHKPFGV